MSTTPNQPSILDKLMVILQLATSAGSLIPGAAPIAGLALKLEQIAQTAIAAHEQITGQPFDESKIPEIAPIP